MVWASLRASMSWRCGDVLLGVVEGFEDHGFYLLVGEAVGGFDFDLRLLTAALFARADM